MRPEYREKIKHMCTLEHFVHNRGLSTKRGWPLFHVTLYVTISGDFSRGKNALKINYTGKGVNENRFRKGPQFCFRENLNILYNSLFTTVLWSCFFRFDQTGEIEYFFRGTFVECVHDSICYFRLRSKKTLFSLIHSNILTLMKKTWSKTAFTLRNQIQLFFKSNSNIRKYY